MKKLLLINAIEILESYGGGLTLLDHPNVQVIQDRDILDKNREMYFVGKEEVFMFFNKKSIDFQSILAFIQVHQQYSNFTVIIDASDFDEADHEQLDSVMETLADYVQLLIADDLDDLRKMVIGLITKYL